MAELNKNVKGTLTVSTANRGVIYASEGSGMISLHVVADNENEMLDTFSNLINCFRHELTLLTRKVHGTETAQ